MTQLSPSFLILQERHQVGSNVPGHNWGATVLLRHWPSWKLDKPKNIYKLHPWKKAGDIVWSWTKETYCQTVHWSKETFFLQFDRSEPLENEAPCPGCKIVVISFKHGNYLKVKFQTQFRANARNQATSNIILKWMKAF